MKKTQRSHNSTLRKVSPKKAAERKESAKLRGAMKARLPGCECCGAVGELDEHHIAAGSHRREKANPRSILYLCRTCHQTVGSMTHVEQYGVACDVIRNAINAEVGRKVIPE